MALVRAVQGRDAVRTEVSLPESSRSLDMLVPVDPPSDAWGLLREEVARRHVLIEHHAQPPSLGELATALAEVGWGIERWDAGRWRAERAPLLLVLSVGRPRGALDFFRVLRPSPVPGVYRTLDPGLEAIVLDVTALPPMDGTHYLRYFDHRPKARDRNAHGLHEDASMDDRTKDAIGEAIMGNPDVFDLQEREVTFREALERGRKEREEEARRREEEARRREEEARRREEEARRREEATQRASRAALLAVARAQLGATAASELEEVEDLEQLSARLCELLGGPKDTEGR